MESIYALLKRFDSITEPSIFLIQTVIKALRKSKVLVNYIYVPIICLLLCFCSYDDLMLLLYMAQN